MTPADLELYEERAAVREYMGNQPRPEAEAGAREDVERMRRLALRGSVFPYDEHEDRNVEVICKGLAGRGITHETEVQMAKHGAIGRIDIVADFDGRLYGFEVKRYDISGPRNIASGLAQAADYARAEISAGTWQGRHLDWVFLGPVPNTQVPYEYAHAAMLSRYSSDLGVAIFDQGMATYAYGAPALKFTKTAPGWKFCYRFDQVRKHKNDFRR